MEIKMISELIRTLQDITSMSEDQIQTAMNNKKYTSIVDRSLQGTLQFPTIVSDSLDIETLQMITKALEKQFASFTQTALTMNPFLDVMADKDAAGYLRKFHKNMGTRSNIANDVMNLVTSVGESYSAYGGTNTDMLCTVMEGSSMRIMNANREGLRDVLEGLNTTSINSVGETYNDRRNRYVQSVMEAKRKKNRKGNVYNGNINQTTNSEDTYNYNMGKPNVTIGRAVIGDSGGSQKYDAKLPNRVLVDNDVKKANELVPTTMHVRTILVDKGKPYGNLDFIAGVKATMHPVPSEEMVENIQRAIVRGGSFFKTLRLTSGEIKFMKDYLLNLTEIRDDVSSLHTRSEWWNALRRRQRLAKFKRRTFIPGDIHPTASIVISMEEVEYLRAHHELDLMNTANVRRLMEEYFLISFTVVDTSLGVAHFLFDGFNDYQTVSFSGLERGDTASSGVDFKDVMKLIQRV